MSNIDEQSHAIWRTSTPTLFPRRSAGDVHLNFLRAAFVGLIALVASAAAQGQGGPLLIDRIKRELQSLSSLERVFVVKMAENQIGAQGRMMFADPVNRNDAFVWAVKVLSFCYAGLAVVTEGDLPEVSKQYRARSEVYSDYVRGKIDGKELQKRERANEDAKAKVLEPYFTQALAAGLEQSPSFGLLAEQGRRLGDVLASHGKLAYTR